MTYPNGAIVKVQITHEDGTVRSLSGEDAIQWGDVVASQSGYAAIHGMSCPEFRWVISRPPAPTGVLRAVADALEEGREAAGLNEPSG